METYVLTTSDNPWHPVTKFREWYAYDVIHGYNTCAYLARMAHVSPELTDEENEFLVQQAIDDICKLNLTGNYIKIPYDEEDRYVTNTEV